MTQLRAEGDFSTNEGRIAKEGCYRSPGSMGARSQQGQLTFPLDIVLREPRGSEQIEICMNCIRGLAAKLQHLDSRIEACRVAVDLPHHHHRKGCQYRVNIRLAVPGASIVVGRDPGDGAVSDDPLPTIRDAFAAATRQLNAFHQIRQGKSRRAWVEKRRMDYR